MKQDLLRIAQELTELAYTHQEPEPTQLPVVINLQSQYRHIASGYIGTVAKVEISWGKSIKLTLHTKHQNGWPAVIEEPIENFEEINE